jgi:hypothetical protein
VRFFVRRFSRYNEGFPSHEPTTQATSRAGSLVIYFLVVSFTVKADGVHAESTCTVWFSSFILAVSSWALIEIQGDSSPKKKYAVDVDGMYLHP